MKIEDILAEIDDATVEDLSQKASRVLNDVYTEYVSRVCPTETGSVTPRMFLEFWGELDEQEKIAHIRRAVQ